MKKTLAIIMTLTMLFSMFAVFTVSAETVDINIIPYGLGMENWTGSDNKGDEAAVTQILICPKFEDGSKVVELYEKKDLDWTITLAGDNGSSKTITLKQSSQYDGGSWGIIRFEPCLAEGANKFVPEVGVAYTVSISVNAGDKTYVATSEEGAYSIDVAPIVPGEAPEKTWPETMKVAPKFVTGGVENWRGSTWFLLGPTFTNESMDDVKAKLLDGTYKTTFVIKNETTGETFTISEYAYDHNDLTNWAEPNGVSEWKNTEIDTANKLFRLCASDYGIPVVAGNTYTITGTIKEGDAVKYNIESEVSKYAPLEEKLTAEAGPKPDFVPPHSYDKEPTGPVEFVIDVYGTGMENWSDQTQILVCPKDEAGNKIADLYATDIEWTFTIKGSDGSEKTVVLVQSSQYDGGTWGIVRFQPCVEAKDNRFVPEVGVNYTISATVTANGVDYVGTSADGAFSIGVEPIVPVDPQPPVTGDATVYAIVFAVVALMGMGVVVTKKVRA